MEEIRYIDFLRENDLMEEENGNIIDKSTRATITTKREFLNYFTKYGI